MGKKLGIFVTTDKHLDKLIEICRSAKKKEIEILIFFTHLGVMLTQKPEFKKLEGLARMSLCNVGFEGHGLKPSVAGITEKDYATQARHGMVIEESDRYLSL